MIDIYAKYFNQNGGIQTNKTLIQTIPARNEGALYLIEPKVSTKTGSAESFDFSIQPNTKYYNAFIQMRTYFYVEYDGDLIFYGRVLTIEQGFYGEQKIKCEGAMAFFNDSYYPGVPEKERSEQSVNSYITSILSNHNTQLNDPYRAVYPGEIPGNYSSSIAMEQRIENDVREFGENGWKQTKSALDDLVSHYGGMFRIRSGNDNKLYLDWLNHYYRAAINNQIVEVGKNLIDASSITEVNNIFTVVIPIGKGSTNDTKLYIDGTYFPVSRVTEFYTDAQLNSGYHLASDYRTAESRYGRIIKPQEFDEADTQQKLLAECAKWVKENYQGGVDEFTVSAVDLHQLGKNVQKILTGDRVRLRYPVGNGQTRERTLTCTSSSYELYNPESNQYTFGIPASSLNQGYSVKTTKSKKDAKKEGSDTPTPGSSGPEPDPYTSWWNGVLKFLKSHKVWYKSVGRTPASGQGPERDDYLLRLSGRMEDGERQWRLFRPSYSIRKVEVQSKEPDKKVTRNVFVWNTDYSTHRPLVFWVTVKDSELNRDTLNKYKLFEYIHDEWEKNIADDMPAVDGKTSNESFIATFFDGTKEKIEMNMQKSIKALNDYQGRQIGNVTDLTSGFFNLNSDNGLFASIGSFFNTAGDKLKGTFSLLGDKMNFGSVIDGVSDSFSGFSLDNLTGVFKNDGDVESGGDILSGGDIFFTDDEGDTHSVNDLQLTVINEKNKFGSLVEKYFEDPEHPGDPDHYTVHAYEFTQSIEDYMGQGTKLVVARVDGDKVHIGSPYAGEVINQAMEHMTSVVGDVEYVTDPVTHKKHWKIMSGSGLEVNRDGTTYGVYDQGNLTAGVMVDKINSDGVEKAKFGFYDNGTLTSGVLVEKMSNLTSEQRVTARTSFGFYDNETLTGGVMVDKLNDGSITTHIRGDRIMVGTVDSSTVKTMTAKFGDLDGLIAEKATIAQLNSLDADISNLKSIAITTNNLSSKIASISVLNVSAISSNGNINTSNGYIAAPYYYIGTPGSLQNMASGIWALNIKRSGNTYTLQKKDWDDADWVDVGSFSRAVSSASWSWVGGAPKATLSPQGQNFTGPALDGLTWSNKVWASDKKSFTARFYVYDTNGSEPYEETLTIDTTDSWNAGAASGGSHNIDIPTQQIYTSGTSRGTRLNVLKTRYEEAKADAEYVMFRVDCGGTSKWYYMEP